MRLTQLIAVLLVSAVPLPAIAQLKIEPTQGLKHVGKSVRVRMTVITIGRADENLTLNFRDSWKAEDCLIVWLDPTAQAAYKKLNLKVPQYFVRKEIEITGRVRQIKPGGLARPAIVVSDPANIRIIETAPKNPEKALPVLIKAEDGLKYIGQPVRVRLRAQALGRAGKIHNLNSGKSWDAPGNLQIRFGPEILAAFSKKGIEHPGLHLLRKHIEVTGVVHEIRPGGKRVPAIDLKSLDDLTYVLQSVRAAPEISELPNRRVDVHLRGGKRFGEVVVTAVESGPNPESIASLKLKIGDASPRRYPASSVEEIIVDGVPLDLSFDRKNRLLFVDEEKQQARLQDAEEAERRVLSVGKRLWPRLSDEQHAEWVAKHKEFVKSTQEHFPELPLRLIETKYFLILTDIPDSDAQKYLAYLDKLYDEMCKAFGIPLGSNIWSGKCIVCAFANRADFIRFEQEVIKNTKGNPTQAGGICHGTGEGRIVISLFKGTFTARFATVLVHETSHGFVNRFRSDIPIPSWLNEGMAVWIAKYIVQEDDTLERAQRKSIIALQTQPTLAGFFDGSQIPGERYGAASAMVDILVNRSSEKFRQFFIDIKLGYPAEEALQRSYRMSFADLTTLYGKRIGMPNLKH